MILITKKTGIFSLIGLYSTYDLCWPIRLSKNILTLSCSFIFFFVSRSVILSAFSFGLSSDSSIFSETFFLYQSYAIFNRNIECLMMKSNKDFYCKISILAHSSQNTFDQDNFLYSQPCFFLYSKVLSFSSLYRVFLAFLPLIIFLN